MGDKTGIEWTDASWNPTTGCSKVSQGCKHCSKAEAMRWALQIEATIDCGRHGNAVDKTFGALLQRYAAEVSPSKAGARWEQIRINAITRGNQDVFPPVQPDPVAAVAVADLDAQHFAAWRDRRLRSVSAGTVLREWTLLSNACSVAVNEWRWLESNPMTGVRRPPEPQGRTRRITEDEIARIIHCLGYDMASPPDTQTARVGAVFLLAIETAMRAGEIVGLHWQDVELDRCFLRTCGKTPAARRDVPLSTEAVRILQQLSAVRAGDSVFRLTSANLDALFRKARARAMIDDLHFHDTRHEGITRLAKRLHILALARAVGHKDLRMLQVYYNESAEDIAHLLK